MRGRSAPAAIRGGILLMVLVSYLVHGWSLSRADGSFRELIYVVALGGFAIAFAAAQVRIARTPGFVEPSLTSGARLALAVLITVLLAARLLYPAIFPDAIRLSGDPWNYVEFAKNLVATGRLFLDHGSMQSHLQSHFPPSFLLALGAALWVTGHWLPAALLVQVPGQAITCLMLFLLGRRAVNDSVGVVAALLFALSPNHFLLVSVPNKEPLYIAGLASFLYCLIVAAEAPRRAWLWYLLAGIVFGITALAHPGVVPFAPVIVLAMFLCWPRRPILMALAMLAIGASLTIGPWTLRNYAIDGRFVPLTTAAGVNLRMANHTGSPGHWSEVPEHLRGLPEMEWERQARQEALQWIRENPGEMMTLVLTKKLPILWQRENMGIDPATWGLGPQARPIISLLSIAAAGLFHVLLLGALGFVAAVAWAAQPVRPALLFLMILCPALVLQLSVMHSIFETGERHHSSVWALIPVLFAAGLLRQFAAWWPPKGLAHEARPGRPELEPDQHRSG
jgi:4-amino-4-deoxy-L-arabinose transferase-like glycosyltransferase